jgi:hypothetical protein
LTRKEVKVERINALTDGDPSGVQDRVISIGKCTPGSFIDKDGNWRDLKTRFDELAGIPNTSPIVSGAIVAGARTLIIASGAVAILYSIRETAGNAGEFTLTNADALPGVSNILYTETLLANSSSNGLVAQKFYGPVWATDQGTSSASFRIASQPYNR